MFSAPTLKISRRPHSVFQSRTTRAAASPKSIPGPGSYFESEPTIQPAFPEVGFGSRAVRFDKSETATPGPGEYVQTVCEARGPTSHFLSRSGQQPRKAEIVGPGRYSPEAVRRFRSQQSPAFADRSVRLGENDNRLPGPADYSIAQSAKQGRHFLATRYPKEGDWIATGMSDAPSPETYNIDRSLGKTAAQFPRSEFKKRMKMEKLGPGSYDTAQSSMMRHSYNSGVVHSFQRRVK
jgi:hypothetical protein